MIIHPRMSKKKIAKVIYVIENFIVNKNHNNPNEKALEQQERYCTILQKLTGGSPGKKDDLDKNEARNLVVALDLYNVLKTDNVTVCWDVEIEKLHHELKKRFSELYNESVYDTETLNQRG